MHHFNNFAPPYGPATIHSTITGPGVSQDNIGYSQYQYFSFNDTTIIAFVEIPKTDTRGTEEKKRDQRKKFNFVLLGAQARLIIRDLTGRYVWDTQLEPNLGQETETTTNVKTENFVLRNDVRLKKSSDEIM